MGLWLSPLTPPRRRPTGPPPREDAAEAPTRRGKPARGKGVTDGPRAERSGLAASCAGPRGGVAVDALSDRLRPGSREVRAGKGVRAIGTRSANPGQGSGASRRKRPWGRGWKTAWRRMYGRTLPVRHTRFERSGPRRGPMWSAAPPAQRVSSPGTAGMRPWLRVRGPDQGTRGLRTRLADLPRGKRAGNTPSRGPGKPLGRPGPVPECSARCGAAWAALVRRQVVGKRFGPPPAT